ncbi:hypothetical protein MPTK1_3g21910 [Marchantia polymorpha subsp. ruderalis]|uniref:Uncharacterized protein n=2 Tax=Marchantia polymorpha TaxID=3197 RepID=A0AAF6B3E3_MARPO|nr:hypothetical protein MARPO_0089s0025 [Marchantia polymorpha]BBN06527.1 hypothetical protein Mp_3g21910 [Marchantia polymorpha subsp. ruderalis]|eukprot:PTQ33391.1 hypothetical protein MARPO_0089s0025 [Marchantia polymorpha]
MEDEREAKGAGQKLQKDIADFGSIDIIRASMKIFVNHHKELVSLCFVSLVGRIYSGEGVTRAAPFRFLEHLRTEFWTSSIVYGGFAGLTSPITLLADLSFNHEWSWSWVVDAVALISVVSSTFALLALVMMAQLATVISEMASCCMEEVSGRAALMKAKAVVKGKWRVGLGVSVIYCGGMLLMGWNLFHPGFAAGFGTRLLFSSFQILLISIWRQLALLCWSVFYVSCRAFHHDYLDYEYALHPDKERIESGSNDFLL